MNETMLTGVLAGAAVITAGMAIASFRILDGEPAFAEVITVQPIVQAVQKAREECPDELLAGTMPAGATPSAFIIASAAAESIAGALPKVAGQNPRGAGDDSHPDSSGGTPSAEGSQRKGRPSCRTVYDSHLETVGYDVVYRLSGREGTVRMDHHPGNRIPVRNGELVLTLTP